MGLHRARHTHPNRPFGLELSPPRDVPDPTAAPAVLAGDVPDMAVTCGLEELGPVTLNPVGGADDLSIHHT